MTDARDLVRLHHAQVMGLLRQVETALYNHALALHATRKWEGDNNSLSLSGFFGEKGQEGLACDYSVERAYDPAAERDVAELKLTARFIGFGIRENVIPDSEFDEGS